MNQSPFLDIAPIPNTKNGHRQYVLGSEFVEFEPSTQTPNLCEFIITGNEPLAFGLASGFWVEGTFQKYDGTSKTWKRIETADATNVVVQQNWFDFLIEQFNIYHYNRNINPNDVPGNIDPYVNAYAYAHMDKQTRKLLCVNKCSPGLAVTTNAADWKVGGSAWTEYSKEIFGKDKIKFRWVPLFQWPFHQATNYLVDPLVASTAVPIHLLEKLIMRVHFRADFSIIFKQITPGAGAEAVKYRFDMTKFTLFAEELRMSPTHGRNFFTTRSALPYPGLTRQAICENINAGVFSHRLTIPSIEFPEGIMIFCVHKSVITGASKFQDIAAEGMFMQHNIKSVDFMFNGLPFFTKRPAIGQLDNDIIKLVSFRDHLFAPPLGLIHDTDLIEFEQDAGLLAYPKVHLNFTQAGRNSRIQAVHDGSFAANRVGDLVTILTFEGPGAPPDCSFIAMAYYSDVNLLLQTGQGKNGGKGFIAQWNSTKSINSY